MQRQHIVIVEDDAIIAARLHDILLSLGYQVSEPVSSGEDAIARAVEVRPDLILMDINLYGGMNGVRAASEIHALMDVPIIYLTAYSDDDLLQQAKVTNPYGYLVKPVQERELQATIEMALHNHAMAKVVRESEERYRAVVVNAMDAVFLFDAVTLQLVETNEAFRRMLGYEDVECVHLPVNEFLHLPEERLKEMVSHALRLRRIEPGERRYRAHDGRAVDVIASGSVITCSGRETICIVAHDITKRKKAEERLQESESRLKIILKSIKAGVLIVDAETHRIEDVNDEATRIFGRPYDDLVGRACHNLVCPAPCGACPITDCGETIELADRIALKGDQGEHVQILKTVKMISIEGRRHLLETFVDVSDRKRAEEALTEERNLLHTVVNSLPHQIYAKDEQKRFILSNICNTASLGFRTDAQILGKTGEELLPKDVAARINAEEDMILGGEVPYIDSLSETFDPSTGKLVRSLQIAKRPLRNAEGAVTGVVGINVDRTKEKLGELEQRESEARFRSIVENIGEGLVIFDLAGTIEYVNRAASELYKNTKEEMVGQNISSFVPPEVAEGLLGKHLEKLKDGRALVYEIDVARKDGERRSLLAAVVARRSAEGRLTGAYETFTDITERKNAETAIAERNRQLVDSNTRAEDQARLLKQQTRELEKARHQAVEASRMKSEFVANMSHEIRTPLNGIIGMASLLQKTDLTQQQARFLSVIDSSSNSLLAIINEILDFSKIEAGKMELKEDDFSLRTELENAAETFWYKAREKGVELTCIVDATVPDLLHGDAQRLRQVLTNLMGNAVKFTQKGLIALHVRFVEENAFGIVLNFTISDTGVGIAPDSMTKLFKPFSQVNGTITREHGGTGLGLTISKRLIELLGGSISVVSRVDRGTIFRFTVTFTSPAPASAARATGQVIVAGRPCGGALAEKKILLVHAEATARKILQMMANAYHMPFAIARSGSSAEYMLAAAAADGVPFDVVFMGEQLVDCTSAELLKRIEADPALCQVKTVLVGPFTAGVAEAVAQNARVSRVLSRFSKQSEFFNVLCSVTGMRKGEAEAEEEEPGHSRSASHPSAALGDEGVRILVVDDNLINQQVATDLLEAMGYRPELASNGEQALTMATEHDYDLIFMDCQMPVMDGYEATRLIRQRREAPERPVIIAMTAHAIGGDKEACLEAGMDDYIAKPIRFEELRLMIEKWKRKIFQSQE